MFSFACPSLKQHVSQWKITCLVNKTSLLGSMEMYSYYEEGTCSWLLVFKCRQCTFNMLFPLVFDSTDVTFSYLYIVFSFIFRFFCYFLAPKSWSGMVIILLWKFPEKRLWKPKKIFRVSAAIIFIFFKLVSSSPWPFCCSYLMYASFRSVTDENSKILTPTRTGNFFVDLNGPRILRDKLSQRY